MKGRLFIILLSLSFLSLLNAQSSAPEPISNANKLTIYSTVLGEDREIFIHEPSGSWGMDVEIENLPVVLVLDADSQFSHTASTIDFLSAVSQGNDLMPRALVIGITNPNRDFDLTPFKGIVGNDPATIKNTGGGPIFLEFITTELLPYIDSTYSTCNHRSIIGHSLGGLLVLEALIEKSEYFDNYLAIDPALGYENRTFMNNLLDTLRSGKRLNEKLFFTAANNRPTTMSEDAFEKDSSYFLEQVDKPNLDFIHLEETKGWDLELSKNYYPDENHFSVPFRTTYEAFLYFYDFYSFPEIMDYIHPSTESKNDLLPRLKKHYKNISEKMACTILPLETFINIWAGGVGHYGRHDLATDLLTYNIELYPHRPTTYNNYGYYLMRNGHKRKALVQFEKSLQLKSDAAVLETKNALMEELSEKTK